MVDDVTTIEESEIIKMKKSIVVVRNKSGHDPFVMALCFFAEDVPSENFGKIPQIKGHNSRPTSHTTKNNTKQQNSFSQKA